MKRRYSILLVTLTLGGLALFPFPSFARARAASSTAPLTLHFVAAPDESVAVGRVISHALQSLGIRLIVDSAPTSHAIQMVASGERDGLIGQGDALSLAYPDLVRVKESMTMVYYQAFFAQIRPFPVKNWADLSRLRVGTLYHKKYIADAMPDDIERHIQRETNAELFTLLRNGQIDVAIMRGYTKGDCASHYDIQAGSVIDIAVEYAYLGSAYGYLADDLAGAIRALKDTGVYEQIMAGTYLPGDARSVLHISSYYPEDNWDAIIGKTLESAFGERENLHYYNIPLYTNRYQTDADRIDTTHSIIRTMFLQKPPDVLIVSDANAMAFVNNCYDFLFKNIPVVFMGIDADAPIAISVLAHATGLRQELSAANTLALALTIYPQTKHVLVVNDFFPMGITAKSDIQTQLIPYQSRLDIRYSNGTTLNALLVEIRDLPKDSILLLGEYTLTDDDIYLHRLKMQREISQAASLPVFSLLNCGNGEIGGQIVNPHLEATRVARMALAILDGTPANQIPMEQNHTLYNTWTFDDAVVAAMGINPSLLPENYQRINPTVPFYESNLKALFLIVSILLVSVSCIFFVAARNLDISLKNTECIYNNLDEPYIYVSDPESDKLLFVNKAMRKRYNVPDDYKNLTCWQVLCPEETKRCSHCKKPGLLSDPDVKFLSRERHIPLDDSHIMITDKIILWPTGKKVHMQVLSDITKAKHAKLQTEARLKLQTVMYRVSRHLIAIADPDMQIACTLTHAKQYLACDHVALNVLDLPSEKLVMRHIAHSATEDTADSPPLTFDFAPGTHLNNHFIKHRAPYLRSDDLQANGFGFAAPKGIRSILLVPIYVGDAFMGVVNAAYRQNPHCWDESALELLLFLGETYGVLFARQKAHHALLVEKTMAESTGSFKDSFLSNMSHELRTAMNTITGMIQLMETSHDISYHKKSLALIKNASGQMLVHINSISEVSRIQDETSLLDNRTFNMERLLMSLCDLMALKVQEKDQTLTINIEALNRSHFIGDETRLYQVMSTLLSTAIDFSPVKGTVAISIKEVDHKGKRISLRFSFSEAGGGITPEEIDSALQAFDQASKGITPSYDSTGFGLYICKELVDRMGGKMWVISTPGRGSVFSFEVSLDQPPPGSTSNVAKRIGIPNIHVLILSPDDQLIASFIRISERMGLYAGQLPTLAEAMPLSKEDYHAVFVDHELMLDSFDSSYQALSDTFSKDKLVFIVPLWGTLTQAPDLPRQIARPLFATSIFNILCDMLSPDVPRDAAAISVPTGGKVDLSYLTILLVDDIFISTEIFISLLQETNAHIDTAKNGKEAVEMYLLNPDKYGIIIMDIQMPVMNGLNATLAIRNSGMPTAKTIPIVALTACVFKEDIERCLAAGMNDHIKKPVFLDTIISKLLRYTKPHKR